MWRVTFNEESAQAFILVPIGREQSGITLIHQKKKVEVLLQLLLSGIIKADVCVAQNSGNLVICKRAFHEELPLVNIICNTHTCTHYQFSGATWIRFNTKMKIYY